MQVLLETKASYGRQLPTFDGYESEVGDTGAISVLRNVRWIAQPGADAILLKPEGSAARRVPYGTIRRTTVVNYQDPRLRVLVTVGDTDRDDLPGDPHVVPIGDAAADAYYSDVVDAALQDGTVTITTAKGAEHRVSGGVGLAAAREAHTQPAIEGRGGP